MHNLENFNIDLEAVFKKYGIDYQLTGANISQKCVGVCCPFCGDRNYHMGVFKTTKRFTCWKCNETGSLYELLKETNNITWKEFLTIVAKRPSQRPTEAIANILHKKDKIEHDVFTIYNKMPNGCIPITENVVRRHTLLSEFMNKRNLSLEQAKMFGAHYATAGEMACRFCFPIFGKTIFPNKPLPWQKMVSYQGRDISGQAIARYKGPHNSCVSSILYVVGDYSKRLVLVEGVLDAWRMGEGVAATFSAQLSDDQINLLIAMKPEQVVLAWDADAYTKALKMANNIAPFLPSVRVAKLPVWVNGKKADPDFLGKEAMEAIISEAKLI